MHGYSLQSLMHLTHLFMYARLKIYSGREKTLKIRNVLSFVSSIYTLVFTFPLWIQSKIIVFLACGNVPQMVPGRKRRKRTNPWRRAAATEPPK